MALPAMPTIFRFQIIGIEFFPLPMWTLFVVAVEKWVVLGYIRNFGDNKWFGQTTRRPNNNLLVGVFVIDNDE